MKKKILATVEIEIDGNFCGKCDFFVAEYRLCDLYGEELCYSKSTPRKYKRCNRCLENDKKQEDTE